MNVQTEIDSGEAGYPDELRPGTVLLHGQYVIQSYLVRGGFGITYLAHDSLDRTVVIKECFPSAICSRVDGKVRARSRQNQDQFASVLRHFIREARRLSKLSHPDIVGVHQVFEERDTAYMALDYVDGSDLLTVLEEDRARLTPPAIIAILRRMLEAIGYIHQKGILHRDISSDNILLDADGNPTLIDFGAARDHATKENRALSALLTVKDGYSPQEFYLSDEPQRASSDLYSLGATFYHIVTGEAPPQSQQRLASVAARGEDPYEPLADRVTGFDHDFLAAIDRSLEIFPDDRFQSAADWLGAISACLQRHEESSVNSQDSRILRVISELVETTRLDDARPENAPLPAPRRRPTRVEMTAHEAARRAAERAAADRQFVDIFGNPIEDVDAWLEAQDRDPARRAAKQAQARAEQPAPQRDAPRGGFFRNLLGMVAQPSAATNDN